MLSTVHMAAACSARPGSCQPLNLQNPSGCVEKGRGHTGNMNVNGFQGRWCLSFSLSLQSTSLQAQTQHAHAPNLLCNITLHPKTVSKSLQMDKDQDLEWSPRSRSMHLSNEPFCPCHQCPWTGQRACREGPPVLRDTESICLPQSRINSDVTIPDESLTCS